MTISNNNYQLGMPRSIGKTNGSPRHVGVVSDISKRGSESPYDSESPYEMNYQMVEVVRNINKFESSIKHKPNVFSVVVQNSNLAPDPTVDMSDVDSPEYMLEKYKENMRNSVRQFVRNTCEGIVPAHTQLFDVQFK